MKLTRSTYNQKPVVQEKKTNTLTAAQKELYILDMNCVAPVGKYSGKSMHWIKANDSSYWLWMEREDIAWSWNCIKLKTDALSPKKETNQWKPFRSEIGEIWLCLQEYEQQTTPSIW